MSKKIGTQVRGKYTQAFMVEAVRLIKGGQSVPVTAKVLNMPTQTLGNWVRRSERGELIGVHNSAPAKAHSPAPGFYCGTMAADCIHSG